jgi:hypothetical protein
MIDEVARSVVHKATLDLSSVKAVRPHRTGTDVNHRDKEKG